MATAKGNSGNGTASRHYGGVLNMEPTSWFRRSVLFWHNSSVSTNSNSSSEDDNSGQPQQTTTATRGAHHDHKQEKKDKNNNSNHISNSVTKRHRGEPQTKKKHNTNERPFQAAKRGRQQKSHENIQFTVNFPKDSVVKWSPLFDSRYTNWHYMERNTGRHRLFSARGQAAGAVRPANNKTTGEISNKDALAVTQSNATAGEEDHIGTDILEGIQRVEQTLLDIALEIKHRRQTKTRRVDANVALQRLLAHIKPPPVELCRSKCLDSLLSYNGTISATDDEPARCDDAQDADACSSEHHLDHNARVLNGKHLSDPLPALSTLTNAQTDCPVDGLSSADQAATSSATTGDYLTPSTAALTAHVGQHSDSGFSDYCAMEKDESARQEERGQRRIDDEGNDWKRSSSAPTTVDIDSDTEDESPTSLNYHQRNSLGQDAARQRRRRNQNGSSRRSMRTRSTGNLASKCQQSLVSSSNDKTVTSCPNFDAIWRDSVTDMYSPVEVEAVKKFLSFASHYFHTGKYDAVSHKTPPTKDHVYGLLLSQQQQIATQAVQQAQLEKRLGDVLAQLGSMKMLNNNNNEQRHDDELTESPRGEQQAVMTHRHSNVPAVPRFILTPASGMKRAGGHVWKISNISRSISRAKSSLHLTVPVILESEPFYLTSHCYKLCLSLRPSTKTHLNFMSVYARVEEGEFDADLKWPLQPTCVFSILDQSRQNPMDYTKTKNVGDVVCDRDNDVIAAHNGIPRPSIGREDEGIGIEKFIPHDVLYTESHQYIVNDAIFVKLDVLLPS